MDSLSSRPRTGREPRAMPGFAYRKTSAYRRRDSSAGRSVPAAAPDRFPDFAVVFSRLQRALRPLHAASTRAAVDRPPSDLASRQSASLATEAAAAAGEFPLADFEISRGARWRSGGAAPRSSTRARPANRAAILRAWPQRGDPFTRRKGTAGASIAGDARSIASVPFGDHRRRQRIERRDARIPTREIPIRPRRNAPATDGLRRGRECRDRPREIFARMPAQQRHGARRPVL